MAVSAAPSPLTKTAPQTIEAVAGPTSDATVVFSAEDAALGEEAAVNAETDRDADDERVPTSVSTSNVTASQGQQTATLTATVRMSDSTWSVSAGEVTFVVSDAARATVHATVVGLVADGIATAECPVSNLPIGSYTVLAIYEPGSAAGARSMAGSVGEPATLVIRAAEDPASPDAPARMPADARPAAAAR
jgi:hypothetical protein